MKSIAKTNYTEADLTPGTGFLVHNQGTCITPQSIKVTISWVGAGTVHYRIGHEISIRNCPLDRFLAILNG